MSSTKTEAKVYRDVYQRTLEDIQLRFDATRCDEVIRVTNFFKNTPRMNSQLYNHLGLCYLYRKEIDKSVEAFQSAIQLDGNNADAHNNLGNVYLQFLGDAGKAISYYGTALRLQPENIDFNLNYIIALELNEQLEEAKREIDRLIRRVPRRAMVWLVRGNIYYALGNLREAFFSYNRAYWYDPSLFEALANRGVVRIKMGNKLYGCRDLKTAAPHSHFAQEQWKSLCLSR